VVGVGEVEVVVGFGGDGGAGADGVEDEMVAGLDLAGDGALDVGMRFGDGCEVAADGASGGEAGLLRDGLRIFVVGSHFDDDLGVPEAGLDGEVCDLSGERGDAEEEECGAEGEGADGGPRVHGVLLEWSVDRAREEFSTLLVGDSCFRTNATRRIQVAVLLWEPALSFRVAQELRLFASARCPLGFYFDGA
jgi:hypothetical protein